MNEIAPKPDSNAIALDYRNFGYLQDAERSSWMERFVAVRETSVPRPKKAIIELLNSCNFDCPMCRVGQYGINLKRAMSLATFCDILSQLPELLTIRLNGLGESTLIPTFDSYIDAIVTRNLAIELITNGSGPFHSYQRILDSAGSIIISWDAADEPTFQRLRRPAKWADSIAMLTRLTKYQANKGNSRLNLLFTLQQTNMGHLKRLIEQCKAWSVSGVIVNIVKAENAHWITENIASIKAEFCAALQTAAATGIALYLPNEVGGTPLGIDGAFRTCSQGCRMPWEEVVIRWNGDVQVCNMFNPYTYGNVFLNRFDDIWNNRFASLFRDKINTIGKHPYCRGCVYFGAPYS